MNRLFAMLCFSWRLYGIHSNAGPFEFAQSDDRGAPGVALARLMGNGRRFSVATGGKWCGL